MVMTSSTLLPFYPFLTFLSTRVWNIYTNDHKDNPYDTKI